MLNSVALKTIFFILDSVDNKMKSNIKIQPSQGNSIIPLDKKEGRGIDGLMIQ